MSTFFKLNPAVYVATYEASYTYMYMYVYVCTHGYPYVSCEEVCMYSMSYMSSTVHTCTMYVCVHVYVCMWSFMYSIADSTYMYMYTCNQNNNRITVDEFCLQNWRWTSGEVIPQQKWTHRKQKQAGLCWPYPQALCHNEFLDYY